VVECPGARPILSFALSERRVWRSASAGRTALARKGVLRAITLGAAFPGSAATGCPELSRLLVIGQQKDKA